MSTKQSRKTKLRKDRQAAARARRALEASAIPHVYSLREAIRYNKRRRDPIVRSYEDSLVELLASMPGSDEWSDALADQICELEDERILKEI
jgi:hypothetical protein